MVKKPKGIPISEGAVLVLDVMNSGRVAAQMMTWAEMKVRQPGQAAGDLLNLIYKEFLCALNEAEALLETAAHSALEEWCDHVRNHPPSPEAIAYLLALHERELRARAALQASRKARASADALHDKPDGNREKQDAIRAAWASGKYSSRDVCAEQEAAGLGMSFSTARKALRNTPTPT